MKKQLFISLLFISLFIGTSFVKAESINNVDYNINYIFDTATSDLNNLGSISEIRNYFNSFSSDIESYFSSFMTFYEDYSEDYPYYLVSFSNSDTNQFIITFIALSNIPTINFDLSSNTDISAISYSCNNFSTPTCTSLTTPGTFNTDSMFINFHSNLSFWSNDYFFSNFYLYFNSSISYNLAFNFVKNYYGSVSSSLSSWLQESNAPIPTLYDTLDLDFLSDYVNENYTEVNLNDYEYIILSFKDYSHLISPAKFFITGQFCPSGVYNYGTREKPYGVNDVCSPAYSVSTPINLYTTSEDLYNHIVYYISAYDTSISNILKVNTNIFDINYVSTEDVDNPVVIVNGRSYPAIPYDNLTSSATSNTEQGFIPGQSTNVFDLTSDSNFIDNLFSNPLQTLQNVWSSILTMFALIGSFIGVLPSTLQYFLYTAFSLALVLGLIKMII